MNHLNTLLEALSALHPKKIDLSLDRMARLLEALGAPERTLPPTIHVAGTNGKGSTVAFMKAIAQAAGYCVHCYTSPHLVSFNERIMLGGTPVSDAQLVEALKTCRKINGDAPVTFFELTTAAAFWLFARHPADCLLLEVGLGGRLDATNVLPDHLAAILTPVSIDHEAFLGARLDGIAAEKAAIAKPGRPLVCGPQLPEARAVIHRIAAQKKAVLEEFGTHFSGSFEGQEFIWQGGNETMRLPAPGLAGAHQAINAASAIHGLRQAGFQISRQAIAAGLARVSWPARLQYLRPGTLHDLCPPSAQLWLDGGHNPAAGAVVADFLAERDRQEDRPNILVCAMLAHKDMTGYFRPFQGRVMRVLTTRLAVPDGDGAHHHVTPPDILAQAARAAGLEAESADSLDNALDTLRRHFPECQGGAPAPRILFCGSLYFAGDILRRHNTASSHSTALPA